MTKANPTHAKDIALHFINVTETKATPAIMRKTIQQAKTLLASGYNKDEIFKVIDYIVKDKGIDMYSLGYVNTCINKILKEINEKEKEQNIKQELEKQKENYKPPRESKSGVSDDESRERNKTKSERFGVQRKMQEQFRELFD